MNRGRPRANISKELKSMRIESSVINYLESLSPETTSKCLNGIHILSKAAMSYNNLPMLLEEELEFICSVLGNCTSIKEGSLRLKLNLKSVDIPSDFLSKVKSWYDIECEAMTNAAKAFCAVLQIGPSSFQQFFKLTTMAK